MEELEIIDGVRSRIEKGWCQGAFAKDRNDYAVGINNVNAVKFCLAGAISSSGGMNKLLMQTFAYLLGVDLPIYPPMTIYNDSHSRQEVLNLVDKAEKRLLLIRDRRRALRRFKAK